MKKKAFRLVAFTLAEVLITLGIIGVVAALTIPTLMQKYRTHLVETKLKEGHSTLANNWKMNQVEYGLNFVPEGFPAKDPDAALEKFEKYFVPNIKFIEVKKGTKGVYGLMPNGSSLYFYRRSGSDGWANVYIFICIEEKDCEALDAASEPYTYANVGKTSFVTTVQGIAPLGWYSDKSIDGLNNSCAGTAKGACTAVIFQNGWKIPDGYPFKF